MISVVDGVSPFDRTVLFFREFWSHLIVRSKSLKVAPELRASGVLISLNDKISETRKC
jgi:hypothetical protein